jgi:hypothetical protein
MSQDSTSPSAPSPFAQKATKVFLWTLGGLLVAGGAGLVVLAFMPNQHRAFDPAWIRSVLEEEERRRQGAL